MTFLVQPQSDFSFTSRSTSTSASSLRKIREEELSLKSKAKEERILKLRESGFGVTKERHGFKGVEYYEELRGVRGGDCVWL